VATGFVVGGLGALGVALIICGGPSGLPGFFETFLASYQKVEQGASYDPTIAWSRVDAMTVIARLPGASASQAATGLVTLLGLLLAGAVLLWRKWTSPGHEHLADRDGPSGADDWSGAFIGVATLLVCYHMVYDALLLVTPLTAVCVARRAVWRSLKAPMRLGLMAAMAFPLINYASSKTALDLLSGAGIVAGSTPRHLLACSSAIALLAAVGLLLSIAARTAHARNGHVAAHPGQWRERSPVAR
jgi:hypothetical protein